MKARALCWPALAALLCCGLALGAAEKKRKMPTLETITGTLKVTKDVDEKKKKEKISAVELITKDKGTYQIALLKNGKRLGGEKGDGEFEVTGYVIKKGDVNILTVKSYKKVKVEEPKEAEGKATDKPEEKGKGEDKPDEKKKASGPKKE